MRQPRATKQEIDNAIFVGSMYSNQELEFLLAHFGEPPEVALGDDVELPAGVNESAVRPILDTTYRLDLLEKAQAKAKGKGPSRPLWCGFGEETTEGNYTPGSLRDVCAKTLAWNTEVRELKRRTAGSDAAIRRAAGAPSLHMWDPDTDIPYLGGVGADADIVRTALTPEGRVPLYVALRSTGLGSIGTLAGVATFLKRTPGATGRQVLDQVDGETAPGGVEKQLIDSVPNALEYENGETTSVVRCPLCGYTEVYESSKPSTKLQAERKMRKHLVSSRLKKEEHRMLDNRLKSGKAGTGSANKLTPPNTPVAPAGDLD